MANVKITELTELAAVDVADNDVLPIVDVGGDTTKKVTALSLRESLAYANDYVTYLQLNSNLNVVSDNVTAAETRLNANLDIVQDNVAALSINLNISDGSNSDVVAVGSDTLTFQAVGLGVFTGDDQVTYTLENTGVSAGLYGGVEGSTTNVAVITVDAKGRITNASNATVAIDLTTLEGNVNIVQDNVSALDVQVNSNLDAIQDNVSALDVQVNANLDSVQDNVSAVEQRRSDNVFFTYNSQGDQANVVINSANVEPSQNNIFSLGAPDKVWKDLYVGPGSIRLGNVTMTAVETGLKIEDADGATTQLDTSVANVAANLNLITDNVNQVSQDVSAVETRRSANITSTTASINAVEARRTANTFYTFNTGSNVIINTANVEPGSNNTFSLGAPDKQWKDLYIGPGSLYVNNRQVIQDDSGTITVSTDTNQDLKLQTSGTGSLNFTTNGGSGAIFLNGTVGVSTGSINFDDPLNMNTNRITGLAAPASSSDATRQADLDEVQGNLTTTITTVDNFGSYANTTLDTKANVSATLFLARANDFATYSLLNANLDVVQDNVSTLTTTVDNFGTSSNANATALALEDAALQTRLGANVNSLQNEDTALQARIAANALVAASNDYVTYTRLDANVSAVQDNVAAAEANIAAIIDGSTAFTGDVTMNQALTVSGNLYVIGAQVDLGISSAQIDDATLLLAANTPADAQLGVDSGIVINRGQDANVFFGFASYGDHIDFIFTDAPADNAAHYPIAYIDVHANTFGTESTTTPTNVAFYDTDDITTGIYWPESNIGFSVGGVNKANIYSGGISAHGVYSQGVELRANDSATYLAALSNDYVTHTQISANVDIVQDNVAQNATDISAVESRRAANIAGAVSTITTGNLTASRALASDGSGKVAVSAVTSTELGYLDGVTSAIQTQIDSKASTANAASLAADIATNASDISTNESTRSSNAAALAAGIATKLASADYTASDVLTKIKTVDGSGSGLDADLLDGQSSTYYAVEATRASNAAALAAGIQNAGVADGSITAAKLAATLDLGALS